MPNNLIEHDHADPTVAWIEDDHQMATVTQLHRMVKAGAPFRFAADFNAGKRNPGRAKAMGVTTGEGDLRLYFSRERVVHVELKKWKGVTSGAQKVRHADLRALGHHVYVVQEPTPAQAVDKVVDIITFHTEDGATVH